MMQVLFRIPGLGLPIFGYGLMLFLAFAVGLNLAGRRARKEGLDREVIYDMAFWVFLGGLLGARLLFVWQNWGISIHRLQDIVRIWEGGIVFYGSMIGGALGFLLYRAFRRFPLLPYMDAVAPSIALGIGIGRLGCFLNGCCYGDFCSIPWLGVRFPAQSPPWSAQESAGLIPADAPWALPIHATQLYSALDGFLIWALLTVYYPIRRRDGEVFGLLMLAYPVSRYLIERLRNDEAVFLAGMTISQAISLVLLLGAFVYLYAIRRGPVRAAGAWEAVAQGTGR